MSQDETDSLRQKKGKAKGSQKGKKNPKAEQKERFILNPLGRRHWANQERAKSKARPKPSSSSQPVQPMEGIEEGDEEDDQSWGEWNSNTADTLDDHQEKHTDEVSHHTDEVASRDRPDPKHFA